MSYLDDFSTDLESAAYMARELDPGHDDRPSRDEIDDSELDTPVPVAFEDYLS